MRNVLNFNSFLTVRCSKEFLSFFIHRFPVVLKQAASPGLMLNAHPEVQLTLKLRELGLLPESYRSTFVTVISGYATDGYDLSALSSPELRSIFTPTEWGLLRVGLRSELVPNLDQTREQLESNRDRDIDPDDQAQPLLLGLAALQKEFSHDRKILMEVNRQIMLIREWIAQEYAETSDEDPRTLSELVEARDARLRPAGLQGRTIFDDIDE